MEVMVSEFDKVKDDAEQYAREHPQQVHQAGHAAESKLGVGGEQGQSGQQDESGGEEEQDGQGSQQGEDSSEE